MTESSSAGPLTWQAEKQDGAKAELIRAALREVTDPELGLSVIELGMIRDLVFEPEQIKATMILTTPFCPYAPAMMEQVRRKITEVTQQPATIELGKQMWDRSMMEEGAGADWGLFGF